MSYSGQKTVSAHSTEGDISAQFVRLIGELHQAVKSTGLQADDLERMLTSHLPVGKEIANALLVVATTITDRSEYILGGVDTLTDLEATFAEKDIEVNTDLHLYQEQIAPTKAIYQFVRLSRSLPVSCIRRVIAGCGFRPASLHELAGVLSTPDGCWPLQTVILGSPSIKDETCFPVYRSLRHQRTLDELQTKKTFLDDDFWILVARVTLQAWEPAGSGDEDNERTHAAILRTIEMQENPAPLPPREAPKRPETNRK